MGFHIANLRVGGESARKYGSFSYTSLFGTITTVIIQDTPLGPHNLQDTPVFEKLFRIPPKKVKVIQNAPVKSEIIQTTPAQDENFHGKLPGQLNI